MIIILLFIFVFLGLSLQSGYAFNSGTNLSFENSVQLSGIYANSGIVTNNDTIHYSIGYGGSGYESYGGTYKVNIGSGGCLQSNVSGENSSIQYYGEDDSEMDPNSIDCSIRYFKVNIHGDQTTGQYISTSGDHSTTNEIIYVAGYESGQINKNGYISTKRRNATTDHDELYVYKDNESILVAENIDVRRKSPLNNNNYGSYEMRNDGVMDLYLWENGSSHPISSGEHWINNINNNNRGTYQKQSYLYIRNGTESILVNTGTWGMRSDDGEQDESISEGGYANYRDDNGLCTTDLTGNAILVHSGNGGFWGHARYEGMNIYGQGLFSAESISGGYDIYVWNGNEAILVDHGRKFWLSKINDNGYATYFTIAENRGILLNLWNGTESILIEENISLPSKISINNYNQFSYQKVNPLTNENELKFWDGDNVITIDNAIDSISSFDVKPSENYNQIFYSKNNGSESELYIRDNGNKIFIGSGNGYTWMNDQNKSGYAIYKTSDNDYDTIFLWNGTESIMIDTGYEFWGFSKIQLSGQAIYNKGADTYRYEIGGFMKKIELHKTGDDIRDKIFIKQTNFGENEYSYTIIGGGEISNLSKYGRILGSGFIVNSSGYIDVSSLNYTGDTIYLLPTGSGGSLGIDTIEVEWTYKPYEMKYFDFDIIMDSEISNSELENFTTTGNYTTELDTIVNNAEINYGHPVYHE